MRPYALAAALAALALPAQAQPVTEYVELGAGDYFNACQILDALDDNAILRDPSPDDDRTIYGCWGADVLLGGPGSSTIGGSSGADYIDGGGGCDDVQGGFGADVIVIRPGNLTCGGAPRFDGGTEGDRYVAMVEELYAFALNFGGVQVGAVPMVAPLEKYAYAAGLLRDVVVLNAAHGTPQSAYTKVNFDADGDGDDDAGIFYEGQILFAIEDQNAGYLRFGQNGNMQVILYLN